MHLDPIHQFEIKSSLLIPTIEIGARHINFTNSTAAMLAAVVFVTALMIGATRRRAVIPGRWQSMAEVFYEFVANTVRTSSGTEGMRFFPFVFTLFMYILFLNLIGLIPFSFTVTSQIVVTATLALLVFSIVVVYGIWKNGLRFFS